MSHEPTISVKGAGNVSAPPDMTVIAFRMSALNRVYQDSVEELNQRVDDLRAALVEAGVERTDLKTTLFNVGAEHEYENKRQVFKGWKAQHGLRLELSMDREKLNGVLTAVTSADIESQLNIHFEVRDKAALRTRVLADATTNARRNAEAIATAAGCRVGKVVRMDYGWSEIRFQSGDYMMESIGASELSALSAPDIEPEDIDASDSVTVVWELAEAPDR